MNYFHNFTHQVSRIFGIEHFSYVTQAVTAIFLLASGLIAFFFAYTFATIFTNKLEARIRSKQHKKFTQWLITHIVDPESPPPKVPAFHRTYLRDAILDLVFVTKGAELVLLKELYQRYGFWEKDLRELTSLIWHVRLAALVRLDQWKLCLGMKHLHRLLRDRNPAIRQITFKNLSLTRRASEAWDLIHALVDLEINHSTRHEIISRLLKNHRSLVLECFEKKKCVPLWPVILKVLGDNRVIEAVPLIITLANQTESRESREIALWALGKIGDPRALFLLKSALRSEAPNEKLAALHSLIMINAGEFALTVDALRADPDPLVRKWVDHYLKVAL